MVQRVDHMIASDLWRLIGPSSNLKSNIFMHLLMHALLQIQKLPV